MDHTYTREIHNKVNEINNENLSSLDSSLDFTHDLGDNTEELIKLVNEFNRPFSEGLKLLIKYSSYDGDIDNLQETWKFVRSKLKSIDVYDKDRKTILNWLQGKVDRPMGNEATRDRIYRLCFALSVSIDNVNWFFNHVYFQRSFYCRRIEEAVYYYCFKNHYNYEHAQQLISEIQMFPEQDLPNLKAGLYTTEIQQELDRCSTDEDLKQYFRKNKCIFRENQANQYAQEQIRKLLKKIKGEIKYDKNLHDTDRYGLIVQEILSIERSDDKPLDRPERLKHKDEFSISCILKCIYGKYDSKKDIEIKKINMPKSCKRNFVSEKIFSNFQLQKGGFCTSKNFDAIRKFLIFLNFYEFWCEYELYSSKFPDDNKILYETYLCQTNDCLIKCGYNELDSVNNYDRLFILCSGSSTPLDALRNFLSYI